VLGVATTACKLVSQCIKMNRTDFFMRLVKLGHRQNESHFRATNYLTA